MKSVLSAPAMAMLIKSVAIISLFNASAAFERDEHFYNNENESFISLFVRKMELSDYKVPEVDSSGFVCDNLIENYEDVKRVHINISEYISELQSKLLQHQPPFEFSGHSVSEKCLKSSKKFLKALENFELWALRSKWKVFSNENKVLPKNNFSARCERETYKRNSQRKRQPVRRL